MKSNNTKEILIYLACALALLTIASAISATVSDAQDLNPFGGYLYNVKYCCNGIELYVGPPVPGQYFYDYTGQLYREYQIFDAHNQWVLGLATPGAVCLDIEADCEDSRPVIGGTILMIGTSF
ncbi:MAG: hypothetical protein HYT43_01350 [Candidatus Taylorbacteria bacterium]|nr:hypothetical protein [Candidatus Taylorbacteria bacterium]